MAIPDYQTFMLPVLRYLSDGRPHHARDAYEAIAKEFDLTSEEMAETIPSGAQPVYMNRIGWARTYLTKAGLVSLPSRGYWQITEEGIRVLQTNPATINNSFLAGRYDGFRDFRKKNHENGGKRRHHSESLDLGPLTLSETTARLTPDEQMALLSEELHEALAAEILDRLKRMHPALFEQVVIDVLVAMGYGGSLQDAGQAVGRTGDGGIDGIIKQDRLGLENVYVQAKRWQGSVGSEVVRTFAGSLQVQGANKGVLITTSEFTESARSTAKLLVTSRVILVDGMTFARLMIEHNVGVGIAAKYEVKKIDKDYFEDE